MGIDPKVLGKAVLRVPDRYAGMNAIETEWARSLDRDPRVSRWLFDSVRFKLAPRTWYLPDFWVLYRTGHVELHEIKQVHPPTKRQRKRGATKGTSGWKEDARVKFKVAAAVFPELTWVACEKQLDKTWTMTRAEDLFKRQPKEKPCP